MIDIEGEMNGQLHHMSTLMCFNSATSVRGLIFPVFAFCVLRLCLAFCILLGANMAANVGRTQEVPRNVRRKMKGTMQC